MSESIEEGKQALSSEVLGALDPMEGLDAGDEGRAGSFWRWIVRLVVLGAVVGLGFAGYTLVAGSLESAGSADPMLTHLVARDELLITITEDGNVESANNVEIKCEVAGGSTILWIIEDGKQVKEGELLVRLDSAQIEEQVNQQRIVYENARAAMIQAENDHSVAEIAVKEYVEGTYRIALQDIEAEITIAMENLRSSQNTMQYTERMFRKGYASPLQREAQEFAVERAKLELESARTAKEVLNEFTKAKTLEDLESQVETSMAKLNAQKASFELEHSRLERLEAQLEKCEIHAPQTGMAVYANDSGRGRFGSQEPQVEEGAIVREQQDIFRLPDLSKMQVKVAVHESKVDQLRRGMRARIRVQDKEFTGSVVSVANQPEPTSFFSANVKEYATIVRIGGAEPTGGTEKKENPTAEDEGSWQSGLRPGMTAEVEILVAHLQDVIVLPVAAVVELRNEFFCWVKQGESLQRRPLVVGLSNDQFIEIVDGVAAGEHVVLNPRAVVAETREEGPEAEPVDVGAKFGEATQGETETAGGDRRAGGAPGERPTGPPSGGGPPGRERSGPPGEGGRGGGGGGGPGGRGGGGGGGNFMSRFDTNSDGKISRAEAPSFLSDRFDDIDSNSDGFIEESEMAEMRNRSGGGGGPGGRGAGGGRGPSGGGPPGGRRPDGGGPPGGGFGPGRGRPE